MDGQTNDKPYEPLKVGEGLCPACCENMVQDLINIGYLEIVETDQGPKLDRTRRAANDARKVRSRRH